MINGRCDYAWPIQARLTKSDARAREGSQVSGGKSLRRLRPERRKIDAEAGVKLPCDLTVLGTIITILSQSLSR